VRVDGVFGDWTRPGIMRKVKLGEYKFTPKSEIFKRNECMISLEGLPKKPKKVLFALQMAGLFGHHSERVSENYLQTLLVPLEQIAHDNLTIITVGNGSLFEDRLEKMGIPFRNYSYDDPELILSQEHSKKEPIDFIVTELRTILSSTRVVNFFNPFLAAGIPYRHTLLVEDY
jgi:hypothetical protein